MQIDGEHVQRGGGFVPYHTTKVAGTYSFAAATRKGGFLKRAKIQWYAAYTDPENYVLYTLGRQTRYSSRGDQWKVS